nr:acyltransferase [Microvirga sp. HBU67558]
MGASKSELFRNNFDYIRIFAATQVLLFHAVHHLQIATPEWGSLLAPFSGVPMFFVTSGFLITASYERSSSVQSYALSRARRIFPGLWGCIAATAAVVWFLGYPLISLQGGQWFLTQLAALIYTPNFLREFGFGSYNGSLWTIPVELQFYATVPVLALLLRRCHHKVTFLLALLFISIALAVLIRIIAPSVMGLESTDAAPAFHKLLKYSFISHYYLFLIGAICYYLALHTSSFLKGRAAVWLVAVILCHFLVPPTAVWIVLGQIFLALFTISAAYTFVRRNWLEGNDISYGTYLYHGLFVNLCVEFGLVGRSAYLYLVLAASYAAGLLSWTLIEKRLLRRHSHTVQTKP